MERRPRVLENGELRRKLGPKKDEWRKLHKEELYDLYCSQNIIQVIQSRIMRWAVYEACDGERRDAYRFGEET
jgi:hypothetical protein